MQVSNSPNHANDAEFIATAREALPRLLDEVEWLRTALTECAEWLESRPDYTEGDAATASMARAALAGKGD